MDGAVRLQRSSSVKPSDKKPKARARSRKVTSQTFNDANLHAVTLRLTGLARFHHRELSPGLVSGSQSRQEILLLSQACSAAKCEVGPVGPGARNDIKVFP